MSGFTIDTWALVKKKNMQEISRIFENELHIPVSFKTFCDECDFITKFQEMWNSYVRKVYDHDMLSEGLNEYYAVKSIVRDIRKTAKTESLVASKLPALFFNKNFSLSDQQKRCVNGDSLATRNISGPIPVFLIEGVTSYGKPLAVCIESFVERRVQFKRSNDRNELTVSPFVSTRICIRRVNNNPNNCWTYISSAEVSRDGTVDESAFEELVEDMKRVLVDRTTECNSDDSDCESDWE